MVEAGGVELSAGIENTQLIDFAISPIARIVWLARSVSRFVTMICSPSVGWMIAPQPHRSDIPRIPRMHAPPAREGAGSRSITYPTQRRRWLLRLHAGSTENRRTGPPTKPARPVQGTDVDPALRKPYRGYTKKQLPMWHRFRVKLHPHVPGLGVGGGIRDKHGHEPEFPSAFRQSRCDGKLRAL